MSKRYNLKFYNTSPSRALQQKGLALGLTLGIGMSAMLNISPVKAQDQKALVFGIVPQQSATRLAQTWVPMLAHLSQKSGIPIRFATAKDIPTFEACLAKGAYDLAYMNPYHFTIFNESSGYKAFARQANKQLKGIIVVRKDSSHSALEQLDKKQIAFPSPAAFGASVIPRAEMNMRDMQISPIYVRSHDSVYRSVAAGLFPAGGGVMRTFGNIPKELRGQLRILYKTDGYTPHAFAAHNRVDAKSLAKITDSMTAMSLESDAVLKPLGMKAFIKAKDSDWNDVRSLNLSKQHTQITTDSVLQCHSG
ncbi:MAG: phosphate/phosphite/phosphonate ABC transporter substrate-binding protein [Cohaesibacter sp.]|nr:phosphate/phosphite/phosphonate ABC transporter substrate-binding protein [Cohaesibacter sp.]